MLESRGESGVSPPELERRPVGDSDSEELGEEEELPELFEVELPLLSLLPLLLLLLLRTE